VVQILAEAEKEGQPLLTLDRSVIPPFFAKQLGPEDVQTLLKASRNEFGRAWFQEGDGLVASELEQAMAPLRPLDPAVERDLKVLVAEGRKTYGEALVKAVRLARTHRAMASALEGLTARIGKDKLGELGGLLFEKSMARVVTAIMPRIGDLRAILSEFRASHPQPQPQPKTD
jgi:hypothetical protein